jgi:hypothetical protein
MNVARKSGPQRHAIKSPATSVPTAPASRVVGRERRFRVETLKRATGKFSLYQTYNDKALAERIASQLAWVGATVRIVAV